MKGLMHAKNGIARAAAALKRSFEGRRGNRGRKPTAGGGGAQPRWKRILLGLLVVTSIVVVASWVVFTIKPAWFVQLKGRIVHRQQPLSAKKKRIPPPKHPLLAARTAKARIVKNSAPTIPARQQPHKRISAISERPQVSIPARTTKPQESTPPSTPQPQISTPPSLSPKMEVDNTSDDYLDIGVLYAQKGKYQKAEELFQKVAKENPSSAKAHNNLGFVYLKEGKYDVAEKEFKDALRIDPASVLPYYNLACLYSRKGMEVEALIYLKRALKRDARVKLWAMTDEDFEGLRSDVVFQELLGISSPKEKEEDVKEVTR